MSSLKKRRVRGFNAERELVKELRKRGIWATRIPVSGIGQPLPDVLAAKSGKLYGFEVKKASDSIIYYRRDFDNVLAWLKSMQKEKLQSEAWLAVRFRGKKWRFYKLDYETESVKTHINVGLSLTQILLRILHEDELET